jgi:hypothetical protein
MRTKTKRTGIACAAGLVVVTLGVTGCEGVIDTRVKYETFSESRSLDGIEELEVDLDFAIGNLEISQSFEVDELFSVDLEYDRLHYEPELDYRSAGSTGLLRFDLDSIGGIPLADNDNDLVLRLAPGVRVEMEMSTGVGQSFVDFTGAWGEGETRADFEVGVGKLRLLIPEELAV